MNKKWLFVIFVAVPGFLVLVYLGVWQTKRLAWKETILENIGSIENVEVERFGPDASHGYEWRVTFKTSTGRREGWDAVRYVSKYDLRLDSIDGVKFNLIKDEWNISSDKSVNYIAKFIKN